MPNAEPHPYQPAIPHITRKSLRMRQSAGYDRPGLEGLFAGAVAGGSDMIGQMPAIGQSGM
jgi:hypothetical protein